MWPIRVLQRPRVASLWRRACSLHLSWAVTITAVSTDHLFGRFLTVWTSVLLWTGLKEVHKAGILNEDLEPRNIVWGSAGPTIVDFSRSSFHNCAGPGKCEELVQACTDIWGGYDATYWPVK